MHLFIVSLFLILSSTDCLYGEALTIVKNLDKPNAQEITINFELNNKEKVYKDSLSVSIQDPQLEILSWSTTSQPTNIFDPSFNENKQVFDKTFQINLELAKKYKSSTEPIADLHVSYLLNTDSAPKEKVININLNNQASANQNTVQQTIKNSSAQPINYPQEQSTPAKISVKSSNSISDSLAKLWSIIEQKFSTNWSRAQNFVSNILENNQSFAVRTLLSFLLGFLMSLTPCIFPMIPVTMGILQSTETSSNSKNFLLALSYTLGVSLTFALLGLAVSSGGIAFGQLLQNPFFVLSLITFLAYLALSMFGAFEMYIPRFLQARNAKVKQGSLISAFVFGALSGTMASPCLSPGLALILSIAASLGSKILGFLLLFAFGVGSALPLLIIGIFSTSLDILPKAGLWMVEVKKLFGFMIFALCFYYLSNLVSNQILLWLIAEFLLITGLWYFSGVRRYDTPGIKSTKNIIATILIASSIFVFMKAYKSRYQEHNSTHEQKKISNLNLESEENFWNSNYQEATEKARAENKKIFLVYTTDFCPNCIVLENKILKQKVVKSALERFVTVKIDTLDPIRSLIGRHKFLSTPSILIIDPKEEKIIKEWQNGVPKEKTAEQFAEELKTYL